MLRKVFYKKSNECTRDYRKQASTSYHIATSTPNLSRDMFETCCAEQSPDVSLIAVDRAVSAPILVSDESIADLTDVFRKKCTCRSRASNPPQGQEGQDSSCRSKVPSEDQNRCHECQGVHELYFNADVKKSDSSVPAGQCIDEECKRTCEMNTAPSMMFTMMFNGLLMCGDSDASDGTKDSGGACSVAESASGSCDAARAHYYHNKLLSTLQILQNKEETIRVQAESLAVAEARISALTDRAAELRRELDRKTKEVHSLRKTMESCNLNKIDVSIMADRQGADDKSDVVNTLQNNLCVIEDLYRECFYEAAKQESLIEMLRKSYLDVRVMDKAKAEHIGRLQTVISQHTCQDLAMEVDTLKMEISNFLNNSNNDSGMWEVRSENMAVPAGVQDELQDIMDQLLRLRELLDSGCMCGLQEENMKLKQSKETMEVEIGDLRHNITELETELMDKDERDAKYKQEIEIKEKQLLEIRQQLAAVEEGSRDQGTACDTLTKQMQQTQALLDEKTIELNRMQEQCQAQESTIKAMKGELERADHIMKENSKIRGEVSDLTRQVSVWRAQLADSERRVRALQDELGTAAANCAHVDVCYRAKARSVDELQSQLEEAHARGAALCEEAHRAVCAVRCWITRVTARHRAQENIIKEKETMLISLRRSLEEKYGSVRRVSASDEEPSCSKCSSSRTERNRTSSTEPPSRSPRPGKSRMCCGTSGSEMASCSSAPVPPKRLLRKKLLCLSQRCGCGSGSRDVSVQRPQRRDASCSAEPAHCNCLPHTHRSRTLRDVSPTEELLLRVERISDALADGQRRWTRARDER